MKLHFGPPHGLHACNLSGNAFLASSATGAHANGPWFLMAVVKWSGSEENVGGVLGRQSDDADAAREIGGPANREKSTHQLSPRRLDLILALDLSLACHRTIRSFKNQPLGQVWCGFPNHARIILQQINSMIEGRLEDDVSIPADALRNDNGSRDLGMAARLLRTYANKLSRSINTEYLTHIPEYARLHRFHSSFYH
jgi:hypothetical protein